MQKDLAAHRSHKYVFDEIVRRIQTFPDPHRQAVARLRISAEAMP